MTQIKFFNETVTVLRLFIYLSLCLFIFLDLLGALLLVGFSVSKTNHKDLILTTCINSNYSISIAQCSYDCICDSNNNNCQICYVPCYNGYILISADTSPLVLPDNFNSSLFTLLVLKYQAQNYSNVLIDLENSYPLNSQNFPCYLNPCSVMSSYVKSDGSVHNCPNNDNNQNSIVFNDPTDALLVSGICILVVSFVCTILTVVMLFWDRATHGDVQPVPQPKAIIIPQVINVQQPQGYVQVQQHYSPQQYQQYPLQQKSQYFDPSSPPPPFEAESSNAAPLPVKEKQ